ncbi:MAG: radical SAM protein [Patescibacteria group bacterium]|nr:radical SAM protein [Patescibacteria group bacterium]MDE1966104.1 radical SAM protein [Patescibacteria group bacterium]
MKNLVHWQDYRSQLAESLRTPGQIAKAFPAMPVERKRALDAYAKGYRFQLTPYLLTTLDLDEAGNPTGGNPLASIFFPEPDTLLSEGPGAYSPERMNWELPSDFVVEGRPAFQLKYADRLLYRASGCMSICSYCFEAHRVVDKADPKKPQKSDWEAGMEYLRAHSEIREFIFSGGDPLLAPDEVLEARLRDLRSIPSIETIRINSAVFMHCPMRITDKLVRIMKRYEVTELGVHIVHPRQITDEFVSALTKFDEGGYGSLMKLAQIPLLAGVNDDTGVLCELLTKLERHRVKAYYLLHGLPWTLGAKRFRTSVYRGVEVLKPLYRTLSHVAWPEYVIVPRGGKASVPLERNRFWLDASACEHRVWAIDDTHLPLASFASERQGDLLRFDGTPEFIYSSYRGQPVIVFRNWRGEWEMYLDG